MSSCLSPSFLWLAGNSGFPGHVENITLISTFMPNWQFPLFVRISLIVDQGPTLLQDDLILTNTVAVTLFPNKVTF